ncbi:MAG: S8 family serine peptidase [Pseudomonadota bacterium]
MCHQVRWTHRALGLIALLLAAGCAHQPSSLANHKDISADAVVIVIDDPRGALRRRGNGPGYNAPLTYADDPILKRYANAIAADYDLAIIEQWPLRNLGVHCFVVERPQPEVLASVTLDDRVKWLQDFNEFTVQSAASPSASESNAQDCVLCQFASEFDSRGVNVTIAVVDTAADTDHPDLKRSRLMTRNFAGNRGNPEEEKHGTAIVGLIAAVADTKTGINGTAPGATVHLLRGCWQDTKGVGRCNTLTLALALDAAIDVQPDILNLSLTGRRDRILDELMARILASGTLVFAAYDEQRAADARFPARHPGVIYAYGIERSSMHRVASDVFLAPRHALSLTPMAGYDLVSGHSVATPQLAGMAARLMALDDSASRARIITDLSAWLDDYYAVARRSTP